MEHEMAIAVAYDAASRISKRREKEYVCICVCMYVCIYIYVPVGQVKRLRYLVILRFHAWLKNVCGGWLSLPPSQVVISRFER